MANLHTNVSGTWKKVSKVWVNVSGTWKRVNKVWVREGGVWKISHSASAGFVFNQTISSNTSNYNLKDAAIAAGWNQVEPLLASITVNSGVSVYSTSTATAAFDTGAGFPTGSSLILYNNGSIVGEGGSGGTRGYLSYPSGVTVSPTAGGSGGPALHARAYLTVINTGVIAGGGGGGGGGAFYGGGGGVSIVNGGDGGKGAGLTAAVSGSAGEFNEYDYGDYIEEWGYNESGSTHGGNGGNGGALGSAGSNGTYSYTTSNYYGTTYGYEGAVGGTAGAAVIGNLLIQWNVTGTRLGGINN